MSANRNIRISSLLISLIIWHISFLMSSIRFSFFMTTK